ncbi:hypothetical protein NQ314_011860 [Rhamnusium bicolor]|uniref:Carboxylic ester hydrolase n=1 Tax=Rhamnusium bicolor TaxID=1586634 RepID=A0AAV8XER3_9CUCU|nr:hypothetical protein NQ314_011860 [Rhamnusium bicolor]
MILLNIKVLLILVLCYGYLVSTSSLFKYSAEELIIEISDGRIKGRTEITITDTTFYSFQGIPYAEPPINKLRFQLHLYNPRYQYSPGLTFWIATFEKNICYQVPVDREDESEDCLFINVYTPRNPLGDDLDEPLLPVMFFIYGGGFVEGSSESVNYGPQHLMEYGVILVTFNYRVGPFGFFSTVDHVIHGNAGLKDQNLALRWVNKNIRFFGGDPEKVTIFGQSAGAASVAYHILSPKSNGLFRAAIQESGSAISPWAYQRNQRQITYQTAGYINPIFNTGNVSSRELLDYLVTVPAKEIDDASGTLAATESADYIQIQQGFFYAPVLEMEHDDAFLNELMYESLLRGRFNKVPLLLGFNSEESLFMTNGNGVLGNQVEEPVEGFSNTVRHGEDLGYIFRRNWEGYNTTDLSQFPESDQLVFKRFITLFTNFAKYLSPTPERDELLQNISWPKVNPTYFPYLDIGSSSRVRVHPKDYTYRAWETIYDEYGELPYDTY